MELDPQVAYCPHCGNTAPQEFGPLFTCPGPEEDETIVCALTQCSTCEYVLLYEELRDDEFIELADATLLWPEAGRLHNAVPEKVRESYQKAVRLKPIHPPAFANQIGVALERMCKDQGATGRSLADKLRDLRNREILPATLAEMTEKVRVFRNLGSHADDDDEVTPADADAIDEFFRAVVEYVYVAPHRVAEVKKRLDASGGA